MPEHARRRPDAAVAPAREGRITEEEIRAFVEAFYGRVREDPELGPVFDRRVGDAWGAHMDRMVDFWSSVLLASGRFRGDPLGTHRRIEELRSDHFDRWLELFEEVLGQVLSEPKAADVLGRARRMRMVLDRGHEPDSVQRLSRYTITRATR